MSVARRHSLVVSMGFPRCSMPCIIALLACMSGGVLVPSAIRADDESACPSGEARTDEGCVKNPEIIRKGPPLYPAVARKMGVEGSVTVSARIDTEGKVGEAKAVRSTATDDRFLGAFEESAIKTVQKWRYRPGTLNGQPVTVYFTVTIDFEIR